jgi:hypothetical protein
VEGEGAEPEQEVLAARADSFEAPPVEALDPRHPALGVRRRDPDRLSGKGIVYPPRGAGDRVSLGHDPILTG